MAESRNEEVERVRGYLKAMAAKWTLPQLVDKARESDSALFDAAAAVPADRFNSAPAAGDWSAAEVFYHVLTSVGDASRCVVSTIRTGIPTPIRPDRLEHLDRNVTLADARTLFEEERGELYETALAADPDARLDVVAYSHPEFGSLNWRETLLFVRVHTLDHTRQLQEIVSAVPA